MQDIWGLCLKRLRNFSERVKGVGGGYSMKEKRQATACFVAGAK